MVAAAQVMRRPQETGVSFSQAVWVGPEDGLEGRLQELHAQQAALLAVGAEEAGQLPGAPMAAQLDEGRHAWVRRVAAAAACVAGGALDKVVLARSVTWQAPLGRAFSPVATAWALRRRQTNSLTFLSARPVQAGEETFVGASLEVLVEVAGAQMTTHALAGTAARSPEPAVDRTLADALLASAKDRREHQVVVDMF